MDGRDRIELLVAVAARNDSGDSRVALFRALDGVELFYVANEVVVDGRPMRSTPLRKLGDGSSAMVVYTSKGHRDLPPAIAGADWSTVLKIAHDSVRADWLVIVSRNNETVAIARDQLPIISAELLDSTADSSVLNSTTSDELEAAISNAVEEHSEDRFETALAQLRGREVYVHLTDSVSEDGRSALLTSAAGGIDGWVLTYTTRMRPGIKYGGLVWEELVRMIKNNAGMPGVRIVNDADDWIILGRDVI